MKKPNPKRIAQVIGKKKVLFRDRKQGFERYGILIRPRRISLGAGRNPNKDRVIKSITVPGFAIRDATGKIHSVMTSDLVAVRNYGRDIPFQEWLDRVGGTQ